MASSFVVEMHPPDRGTTQSLVRCDTCGRSFHPDVIDRHIGICQKVFNRKRNKFDSVASRLGDLENATQLIRNAKRIEQEAKSSSSSRSCNQKPKEVKAMPKWKQQSLQFRQAILAAKGSTGDSDAQKKADRMQRRLEAAGGDGDGPDMQRCPHCHRTFNKIAAERHIPICQKTFGSKPGGGRLLKGGGRVCGGNATHTAPVSSELTRTSVSSGAQYASEALQRTPPAGRRDSTSGAQYASEASQRTPPAGRKGSIALGGNLVSKATSRKSSATPSSATRSRSGSIQLTSSGRREFSSAARPNLGAPQRGPSRPPFFPFASVQ